MIMSLVFLGEPVGKGRPRYTSRGRHPYTPKGTADYENRLKQAWQSIHHRQCFNTGALSVHISAYYKIPKSATVRDRERMMYGELAPLKKPDLDNIVKIVLDALNGIAYTDDKQVVSICAEKHYSADPRVEVYIEEVDLSDVRQS